MSQLCRVAIVRRVSLHPWRFRGGYSHYLYHVGVKRNGSLLGVMKGLFLVRNTLFGKADARFLLLHHHHHPRVGRHGRNQHRILLLSLKHT
jgi:hypothetical protein